MSDLADTVKEAVDAAKEKESKLNAMVAVCVAIAATFVALCNVKDGNIVQGMAQAQARAVDTWTQFQAKSTKQHLAEMMVDELTIDRQTQPNQTPEATKLFNEKIASYEAKVKQYEKEKGEIKEKAEEFEKEYDRLNVHDDQFDMAEATISVSIALFGVTALTQKKWLLFVGGTFALFGIVLGLAGFLGLSIHPDFLARLLG
jgi:hypothetical protein